MAKFKKTSKKSTSTKRGGSSADMQDQTERLSKTLSESAQQIWLAGVGAFGRAQTEGSKLFEGLVRDGAGLERSARRFAGNRADEVRGAVENRVDQARERATDTWDRLEKVFEDRVQRALNRLGVPGRDDISDLSGRVDTLTSELRHQRSPGAASKRTPAGKKTARKSASKKATSKKAASKKAAAPAKRTARKATRKTSKKATRKAARPRKGVSA